jgi:hypothetical protein
MIFKPCGSFQLSGYQRVHLAGRWHSPSRSGGGQSILRERRKPVREEVTIRPVQGFPDPLSQLRRGVDVVGIPVGQRGDPIRQREGCRQRPDPRDYGQPGRQVGQKPAPVAGPVRGAPVDAEWWAGDPINLEPAIRAADPEGWGTPTVAASAGGVPRSFRRLRFMPGCIIRSTDARFCRSVPKCPAPSTLLRDRTEPGSACQRP